MPRRAEETRDAETVEELIAALKKMPPWTPLRNPKNVLRVAPTQDDDDYSPDDPGVCVIV
jgi:hypothetical protein